MPETRTKTLTCRSCGADFPAGRTKRAHRCPKCRSGGRATTHRRPPRKCVCGAWIPTGRRVCSPACRNKDRHARRATELADLHAEVKRLRKLLGVEHKT